MTTLTHAVAVVMLASIAVAQATLTGVWSGQTPNRQSITLELSANGTALAGTMTVGKEKATLENGKASKNAFAFTVTMGGGTEGFTGEFSGDEIKMWMDDRGPAAAIILRRSKVAQK